MVVRFRKECLQAAKRDRAQFCFHTVFLVCDAIHGSSWDRCVITYLNSVRSSERLEEETDRERRATGMNFGRIGFNWDRNKAVCLIDQSCRGVVCLDLSSSRIIFSVAYKVVFKESLVVPIYSLN